MDIEDAAMEALIHYEWPGNVRELENVIERGVILEEGQCLAVDSLPERVLARPGLYPGSSIGGAGSDVRPDGSLVGTLEDVERDYMMKVLEVTGWQKKKASSILGINSSTLYRKIQRYGLEPENTPAGGGADDEDDDAR
jgi:DNA-binding NtrC family response regulator